MIEVYNADERDTQLIRRTVLTVFRHFRLTEKDWDVEVSFVEPDEIKEMNHETRSVDAVTDVLSFQNLNGKAPFAKEDFPEDVNPESGAVILGEICICRSRAEEQATEYGHSLERELSFLTCHGTLHLLGYDHLNEADEAEMFGLQDEILGTADSPKELVEDSFDPVDADTVSEVAETPYGAPIKVGFIAVLGKPNAGKSTLVNALVGEKVSIVSWKPQTTRNSILGIFNDDSAQMVFIDTPGLHAPQNTLGKFMMHGVTAALNETDFVLYVVDSERGLREEDDENVRRYLKEGKTVTVAVNKVDHVTKEKVAGILTTLNSVKGLNDVVPVSALRGKNLDILLSVLKKMLPDAEERMFDADLYTTQSMRFLAAETIREKALRLLDEEIPYGIGVSINKYEYRDNGILDIDADVIVENKNHKPIVLGKGGSMIKKISTYARQDLEEITGDKIFMTLWVRVKESWRDSAPILDELGYIKKKNDIM